MYKRIEIAERLLPFSHRPGTAVMLPRLNIQAEIFPCLIRFYTLDEAYPVLIKEYFLQSASPVERFTVCQNLEKDVIDVEGVFPEGRVRYRLLTSPTTGGVRFNVHSAPDGGIRLQHGSNSTVLRVNDTFKMVGDGDGDDFQSFQFVQFERLSLGNNKKLDWELVNRRLDLKEIFPIWLRLGQMAPRVPQIRNFSHALGTFALLRECEENLNANGGGRGEALWLNLYRAAFHGIMVPRLEDTDFQGYLPPTAIFPEGVSPLPLLAEGARLIRKQFVDDRRREGGALMILPHLLSSFTCGRLINVALGEWGILSMEWSKRKIRRLVIRTKEVQELPLDFGPQVRSFRLQNSLSQQGGERLRCPASVSLVANCDYLFDNFL